jgi:hypothetical protein
MKKSRTWNIAVLILAAILSMGFAACSDSDDDDPGPGPLGGNPALGADPVTLADIQVYEESGGSIVESTGAYNLTYFNCISASGGIVQLANELDGSPDVSVTGGKLSLTLTAPKAGSTKYISWSGSDRLTVSSDARILCITNFEADAAGNGASLAYMNRNGTQLVWFIYAEQDVTATGTLMGADSTNLNLKAGWNMALASITGSGTVTNIRTGAPDANFVWGVMEP